MTKTSNLKIGLFCILLILLCLAFSAAAAGASEVYVNNVKLDKDNQYWKNNNAAASKNDWNAYFDVNSATLTLRNAYIDTLHHNIYQWALVYSNGDITIQSEGSNTLQYTAGTDSRNISGIWSGGALTLAGSGRLQVRIIYDGDGAVSGVRSEYGLAIQSGVVDLQLEHNHTIYGTYVHNDDLTITGGQTTITCSGLYVFAMSFTDGDMRMTGGRLYVSAEGSDRAYGIYSANAATLENATARITAQGGSSWGYGVFLEDDTLTVTGGDFTIAGNTYAMRFSLNGSETRPVYVISDTITHVSEHYSGADQWIWESVADGELAYSTYANSPFRYIRFYIPGPDVVEYPRTGDDDHPWRWFGIGALCLFAAAGLMAAARRKRSA